MLSSLSCPRALLTLFVIPALATLLIAIIGGILNYSPVPFADMWLTLNFMLKVDEGEISQWWQQHNEHRIVIARLLFWLDYKLFAGRGIFLEVLNYLLLAAIYSTLYVCLRDRLQQQAGSWGGYVLALIMLTLEFSWLQRENLTWTFQSQFFLAQLLPLLAFYCLHKAHVAGRNHCSYFMASCVLGVAALGSMANGVLTFPLLALLAILLRMPWQRIACLVLLAIGSSMLYFYDYHSPAHHGSLKNALLQQPLALLQYILLYLGAPIYKIVGIDNYWVAYLAAIFMLVTTSVLAWRSLKHPHQHSLVLALLLFIIYIVSTAIATGGGRLVFGLSQALSERYTTPTLMIWSTILILYAPLLVNKIHARAKSYLAGLFMLQLLFLAQQIPALASNNIQNLDFMVATLAAELGIKDLQEIQKVHPLITWDELAAIKERNMGIFNHPLIKDAQQALGVTESYSKNNNCVGFLDNYQIINDDPHYVRITGWMHNPQNGAISPAIHILNKQGSVIGIVLSGGIREDLPRTTLADTEYVGFKGYMTKAAIGQDVILNGVDTACSFQITVNLLPVDRINYQLQKLAQHLGIKDGTELFTPSHLADEDKTILTLLENAPAIGSAASLSPTSDSCGIKAVQYRIIGNDRKYVRITGQFTYPIGMMMNESLQLVDQSGKVAGYAINSETNSSQATMAQSALSFKGYLVTSQLAKPLFFYGMRSDCQAHAVIVNFLPFKAIKVNELTQKPVVADTTRIVNNLNWQGSDELKTQIAGYKVFGSYLYSAQDVGSISLKLHKGETIFYRSGPTAGRQILTIQGLNDEPMFLPVALEWTALEFNDAQLPASFTLTIEDRGATWGEWSAIGLRN